MKEYAIILLYKSGHAIDELQSHFHYTSHVHHLGRQNSSDYHTSVLQVASFLAKVNVFTNRLHSLKLKLNACSYPETSL